MRVIVSNNVHQIGFERNVTKNGEKSRLQKWGLPLFLPCMLNNIAPKSVN